MNLLTYLRAGIFFLNILKLRARLSMVMFILGNEFHYKRKKKHLSATNGYKRKNFVHEMYGIS